MMTVAWTRDLIIETDGEKWLYLGLNSKVESAEFPGVDVGCGRLHQISGLHNWINGGVICHEGEHMGKWDMFNLICP